MKYKYLILTEDYHLFGTNDFDDAVEAAESDMVFDVSTGAEILTPEQLAQGLEHCNIREWVQPPSTAAEGDL